MVSFELLYLKCMGVCCVVIYFCFFGIDVKKGNVNEVVICVLNGCVMFFVFREMFIKGSDYFIGFFKWMNVVM